MSLPLVPVTFNTNGALSNMDWLIHKSVLYYIHFE